jgi:hypothetical protein
VGLKRRNGFGADDLKAAVGTAIDRSSSQQKCEDCGLKRPTCGFADRDRKARWCSAGLLTQGVPGVPQDPFAPHRRPLISYPDRESPIGNAPALVPGPVARL